MILVFAFAGGINSGDVGGLILVIDPQAAHGVVHRGKNFHGFNVRVDADEFLVNFEDAFEFALENFAGDVRDVEIDGGLADEAQLHFEDDFVDGAGGDVARDQVAVFRIPFLEEIKALGFGNLLDGARILRLSWGPTRGRLRRAPIRSSGGICLRRESRWDGPE